MVGDLEAVVAAMVGEGPFALAGHSMGSHTAVAYALRHPEQVAGLVVIGPVYSGEISVETLAYWDGLAAALEGGGIDGFVDYIGREQGIDPAWRDTVLRFTRARMLLHRHPEALVDALRQVPRSRPFESMRSLEGLDVPALVVASHDDADPGHPSRGGGGLRRPAAAGEADRRGRGGVAARLAGRQALAGDRRLLLRSRRSRSGSTSVPR